MLQQQIHRERLKQLAEKKQPQISSDDIKMQQMQHQQYFNNNNAWSQNDFIQNQKSSLFYLNK